jgi:hypothetical protein
MFIIRVHRRFPSLPAQISRRRAPFSTGAQEISRLSTRPPTLASPPATARRASLVAEQVPVAGPAPVAPARPPAAARRPSHRPCRWAGLYRNTTL